jgi:hypothetical protein
MSNSAILASKYENLTINKNGKVVDISGAKRPGARTTSFDYYESLLSPNVTALMTIVDTGGTTESDSKYDRQQRIGTLYNALPITGGEKIEAIISSGLGKLSFDKRYPFYVNGTSNPSQESNREAIMLSLVSNPAIIDAQSTLFEKYNGRISDSVRKMLKVNLNIPDTKLNIEPTKNSYSFLGRGKQAFQNILELSSKSIPVNGHPGYFFYETQRGFNFRSIDSLISQKPYRKTYRKYGVLKEGITNDSNNYKILSASVSKNQDVLSAIKSGVYISKNNYFDPRTFTYTEDIVTLNLDNSLGKEPDLPSDLTSFSKVNYGILDIGTLDSNLYGETNNNPKEYQAKSAARYNILFSQILNIQIPCNPELMAGDIITCEFEAITQGQKETDVNDPTQTGNYLILHLCHHFDPKRSYTSLTLVRDTYGRYTSKN